MHLLPRRPLHTSPTILRVFLTKISIAELSKSLPPTSSLILQHSFRPLESQRIPCGNELFGPISIASASPINISPQGRANSSRIYNDLFGDKAVILMSDSTPCRTAPERSLPTTAAPLL